MEDETNQIISIIKEQGERAERHSRDQMSAIQSLASEIRDFGQTISSSITGSRFNGKRNGNGIWPILFGVGALVFGLMTPLYIMIGGIDNNLSKHEILSGHPATANSLAAMQVHNQEIETQFRGVSERIDTIIKGVDEDNLRESSDISSVAALWERVFSLERETFGGAGPVKSSNGSPAQASNRSMRIP